ncbi:YwiC-like family protein [uncultured Tessaracoccus sp.]|uniref:YwiC-like family protein n=1 Tax=uncultured Tessaracoccus sp. TaxID=905023 RepID=UPI0025E9BC9D|nr:YwiC-like family protein [uncultured Tessaracoccus sp.]
MRGTWVPNQHGAWAMVVVPYLLGLLLAAEHGAVGWAHGTLFVFWFTGYCTFHAASGWLKAAPRRRPRFVPPLATWACVSTAAGLATLALTGWRPLLWVPAFVPLVVPALWLASRRRERATVGGLLTVTAAALMLPVARYLLAGPAGDLPHVVASTALVFGYFFGTVLFVKTNIRERGVRGYLVASVTWHALLLAGAVVCSGLGLVGWWWVAVLAVVLVRTVVVPPLRLRPMALGLIEVGVCLALVAGQAALG